MVAVIILACFAIFLMSLVIGESIERNKGIKYAQSSQHNEETKHVAVEYPIEEKNNIEDNKLINDMGKKHRHHGKGSTTFFPAIPQKTQSNNGKEKELIAKQELSSKDAYKILTCASMRINYLPKSYTKDEFRSIILNDLYFYVVKRENEKKKQKQ